MLSLDYRKLTGAAEEHCERIIKALSSPKRKKPRKPYFDRILNNLFPKRRPMTLEKIIKATPMEMRAMLEEIQSNSAQFDKQFFRLSKRTQKPCLTKSGREFYDLYSLLGGAASTGKVLRHVLFAHLDLKTCPYCNRIPISSIEFSDNYKQTGDLDHIIPRAKHPVFAVSFFNLVPACKLCNFLKNDRNLPIINPYNDRLKMQDDLRFGIQIKNGNYPSQLSSFELSLYVSEAVSQEPDLKMRVENSMSVFNLKELYSMHKDIAHESIQRHFVYSDVYQEELFQRYGGSVFADKAAVSRMLFGRYPNTEDLHLRPLSKFTRDIEDYLEGYTSNMSPLEP